MPAALLMLLISTHIQDAKNSLPPHYEQDFEDALAAVRDTEEECLEIRLEKKVDPKIKSQNYRNCTNELDRLKKELEKILELEANESKAKTVAKTTAKRKTNKTR